MLVREGNKITRKKNTYERVNVTRDSLIDDIKKLDADLKKEGIKLIFDYSGGEAEVSIDKRSLKDYITLSNGPSEYLCHIFCGYNQLWTMVVNGKRVLKDVDISQIKEAIKKLYNKAIGDK